MLARDWYYTQRRRLGLDSAVASIYDRHDDSDERARAALAMLGVQKGWRIADIGCGNGVLACEAALMGAEAYSSMGACCEPDGYSAMFSDRFARRLARRYRRRGLSRSSRAIVSFLTERGITGASILEIGGGVGDIVDW